MLFSPVRDMGKPQRILTADRLRTELEKRVPESKWQEELVRRARLRAAWPRRDDRIGLSVHVGGLGYDRSGRPAADHRFDPAREPGAVGAGFVRSAGGAASATGGMYSRPSHWIGPLSVMA